MDRQARLKVILLVAALVLVAIMGSFWYLRFRTQTPEYALKEIERSVERHDTKTFYHYVDVDRLLDHSYKGFVDGLLSTEIMMPEEAKGAVGDLVQMMKAPILASFQSDIEQYVATGNWGTASGESDPSGTVDVSELLARSGLHKTEFRQVESIQATQDENRVIANLLVYQQEAGSEFAFEAVMEKAEDGFWRIEEIQNFKDFVVMVGQARRSQLDRYLLATTAIMEKHDRIVREAELKYGDILSSGSLGNQSTRDEIKLLMTDVIQKDWEERKQELFSMEVPEAARTLHHLRLRICDLHIEYAKGYALWMTDKKSSTIREADAKLKEAKTLEQEARALYRRMDTMKKS